MTFRRGKPAKKRGDEPDLEPTGRPNLLLIGLRGSGKSTIGRLLAARTGRKFFDLDDLTPGFLGETGVAEAFTKHGEAAFRAAEHLALTDDLLWHDDQIIALGGGTPMGPKSRALLVRERDGKRAVLVYLRASAGTLTSRLLEADNAHRPSLTGRGTIEEVADVLAARDPVYTRLADWSLDVDEMTPESVAAAIDAWLRDRRSASPSPRPLPPG